MQDSRNSFFPMPLKEATNFYDLRNGNCGHATLMRQA